MIVSLGSESSRDESELNLPALFLWPKKECWTWGEEDLRDFTRRYGGIRVLPTIKVIGLLQPLEQMAGHQGCNIDYDWDGILTEGEVGYDWGFGKKRRILW